VREGGVGLTLAQHVLKNVGNSEVEIYSLLTIQEGGLIYEDGLEGGSLSMSIQ
jgi:hypothetical protein